MVHLHIQIPPESIEIYQKCTLCRVFFSMNYHFYGVKYVQLWIPIIPMSDEIYQKYTLLTLSYIYYHFYGVKCVQLWIQIIPMRDEIYPKYTLWGGGMNNYS